MSTNNNIVLLKVTHFIMHAQYLACISLASIHLMLHYCQIFVIVFYFVCLYGNEFPLIFYKKVIHEIYKSVAGDMYGIWMKNSAERVVETGNNWLLKLKKNIVETCLLSKNAKFLLVKLFPRDVLFLYAVEIPLYVSNEI